MKVLNPYIWGEARDSATLNEFPGDATLLVDRPHFSSMKSLEDIADNMYVVLKSQLRYLLLPHFLVVKS